MCGGVLPEVVTKSGALIYLCSDNSRLPKTENLNTVKLKKSFYQTN